MAKKFDNIYKNVEIGRGTLLAKLNEEHDTDKLPALAPEEEEEFEKLEQVIHNGLQTFIEVGQALFEIRDKRLYRGKHSTFEIYCRDRWNFTDRYARNVIKASEVALNVSRNNNGVAGIPMPDNERQARALYPLHPYEQKDIWKEVVEESQAEGRQPTTQDVERKVAVHQQQKKEAKIKPPKQKPETPLDEVITPESETGNNPDLVAEDKMRVRNVISSTQDITVTVPYKWIIANKLSHLFSIDRRAETDADEFRDITMPIGDFLRHIEF